MSFVGCRRMRLRSSADSSARSAPAICSATSVWIAKMSVRSRSYVSAQRCSSLSRSMSCATMRTRLPARRTLPSSSVAAPSCSPISRRLRSRFLNCITDVREITLIERTFDRCAITSSVIPSAKNSLSGSALRLRNGRTATDARPGGAAGPHRDGTRRERPKRERQVLRGLKAPRPVLLETTHEDPVQLPRHAGARVR